MSAKVPKNPGAKKKRKKKSTSAADKIKPARSAYIFFSEEWFPVTKKIHPTWTFGELAKEVGAHWQSIKNDPQKSKHYLTLAKLDKMRYEKEKAAAIAAASSGSSSSSAAATPVPDYVWDVATKTLTINANTSDDFRNRTDIENVSIETGVTTITSFAFSGCSSLASVTFPDALQTIEAHAFRGCRSLASLAFPDALQTIEEFAFSDCSSLASVVFPASVQTIWVSAFYGCDRLASVTLPAGLQTIGYAAFWGCSRLAEIKIPHNLDTSSVKGLSNLPTLSNQVRLPDPAATASSSSSSSSSSSAAATPATFKVGDYVKIKNVTVAQAKKALDVHNGPGWNSKMTDHLGELGKIISIANAVIDITVRVNGSDYVWTAELLEPTTAPPVRQTIGKWRRQTIGKWRRETVLQAILRTSIIRSSTGKSINWKLTKPKFEGLISTYNMSLSVKEFEAAKRELNKYNKFASAAQTNKKKHYDQIMDELNGGSASSSSAAAQSKSTAGSSSSSSAASLAVVWVELDLSGLTRNVRVQAYLPESVSWHEGVLKVGGRVEFDDGDIKQYKISTDGKTFQHNSPGSRDGAIQPLFEDVKTPYVLLGSEVSAFQNIFATPNASGKMKTSSSIELFARANEWVLTANSWVQKNINRSGETEPPHIGWSYSGSPCVLIRNQGADKEIPTFQEWLSGVEFQCDIANDLTGTSSPEWVTYGGTEQNKLAKLLEEYVLNGGSGESDTFKLGSGEYKVSLARREQERTNAGNNGQKGYKRTIRAFHRSEKKFKAPAVDPRIAFNNKYPNFPSVQGSAAYTGMEVVPSQGQEPAVMRTGRPGPMGSLTQAQIQNYFGWKAETRFAMPLGHTFVNYYAFEDAAANLKRLLSLCHNEELLQQSDPDHQNAQVKCAILYHATAFGNLSKIKATGFKHLGRAHGAMCGKGAYFAVHPYVDYCTGNNLASNAYCTYDQGYTAVFVCAGAVVPSEYTYNLTNHGSFEKAGNGKTNLSVNGTTVNTENNYGICGGSFWKDFVRTNGTFPKENREVVFWFDKVTLFTCILGVCVLKNNTYI